MTKIKSRMTVFERYLPLLYELVFKDIKVRYRGSVLGLLWSVLNPLLNMVVMTVVFSTIFRSDIPNFPVYYLSGYLFFTLNQEATTEAMTSIIYSAGLMKKVYVPKYIFPLAKVITALVNCLFSIVAMFIIILVTRAPIYPTLLLIPVILFYMCIFSTGLGLLLAAVTVRFRDMKYFYTVFVYAWTFLTPIFYPLEMLPAIMQQLETFNPMYHYINFSRNIILYGVAPSLTLHLFCLGAGVLMLLIGIFAFHKMQDTFIYYV